MSPSRWLNAIRSRRRAGSPSAVSILTSLAGAATDRSIAVTDALIEQAERALASEESAGDLQLDFTCEACGHAWQDAFDIGGYLWREVDARARRLMRDVDVLARAYGWTESEVLALSDARRAAYVELATA